MENKFETQTSQWLGGMYITVTGSHGEIHGKVLRIDSPTIMTVKWYHRWQWFWVSLGLSCKNLFTRFW